MSIEVDKFFFDGFLSNHPVRSLTKNRPLLYQGEVPTMAFYIKSGVVKIYNITSQGEEKIVGYESQGGLLPIEWLFGHAGVSMYYYDTFTDCELIRVPKDELLQLMTQKPTVTQAFLVRYIAMYIGATMQIHALEQSKVRQKLLSVMQYLVLRFGKKTAGDFQRIDLRLTHQELANLMGTSRETTSTEMGKLTREGVVKLDDGQYMVNVNKALRVLGEDDFSELNL
jgi:CRP-like cAMP-binding protein